MLTPRLNCIIKYVDCRTAADVGTDHAYVSVELIRSGRAKRVIASDVREGPLSSAASNIEKYGLSDKIETRLGSGLSVLSPGEADTIIIAGMGGELIEEIIRADEETARSSRLILQPMNSQYELRKFLLSNSFRILKEDIECEGHRVYNVMIVESGKTQCFDKDIDYHLPPYLYKHEKFKMLLDKKMREFNKVITGLEKSENCDIIKLEYFKSCRAAAEEIEYGIS